MDAFDQLLDDVAKGKNLAPKKKPSVVLPSEEPARVAFLQDHTGAEAVTLIIFRTKCQCGAHFIHPNRKLVLRQGKTFIRPKMWICAFNVLPREIKYMDEHVSHCGECFESTPIIQADDHRSLLCEPS